MHVAGGTLEGARENGVSRYLGVPFAAPPVGALRWRAPEAPHSWRGMRQANAYSSGCVQTARGPFGPFTHEFVDQPVGFSEDCLYLNVWTPASARGATLPILVWIHGGGFAGGSTSVPIYDGAALARTGIIVVSVNYRLGTFGFFAADDTGPANFGMLDVIAALRWLHANAAAFGGDANRITISGQSAGGAMVDALMVSPMGGNLFSGAISESFPLGAVAMRTREQGAAARATFLRTFGVADADHLRAVPAADLQAATDIVAPGPSSLIIDGVTLDGDMVELAQSGRRNAPHLMAGVTATENAYREGRIAYRSTFAARYGAVASRLLELYPAADDAAARAAVDQSNLDRMVMGLRQWTEGAPAHAPYLYVFAHVMPGPDSAATGAFHTSEVPYVFHTLSAAPERGFTAEDEAVSARMMAYWSNFVKTGDPNSATQPHWAPATSENGAVMELGGHWAPLAAPAPERQEFFRDYFAHGGRAFLF